MPSPWSLMEKGPSRPGAAASSSTWAADLEFMTCSVGSRSSSQGTSLPARRQAKAQPEQAAQKGEGGQLSPLC